MSILSDVNAGITQAMKAHEASTLSALRMLKAALINKEVEKGRALEPGEELQVVATLIKQRRDSIVRRRIALVPAWLRVAGARPCPAYRSRCRGVYSTSKAFFTN